MKWNLETYKCAVLTMIAILLAVLLWRMPEKPISFGQMRSARMKGLPLKEVLNSVPVVYVQDGTITVGDFEKPLPVEVENTVEVEIEK